MGLRDFFSSSNPSDNAAEAILTLDLSNSPTAREHAVDALHQLPADALRTAAAQLPDSSGRQVAEAVVRKADRIARDEAYAARAKANRYH